MQARRHARINPIHVASVRPVSLYWLIRTVVLLSLQPGRGPHTHRNGRHVYCRRFLSTTLSPINATSTIHRRILPSTLALKKSSPQLHVDDCALTGRSGLTMQYKSKFHTINTLTDLRPLCKASCVAALVQTTLDALGFILPLVYHLPVFSNDLFHRYSPL